MIVIPEEWICVPSSENDDFGLLRVTVTEGKKDYYFSPWFRLANFTGAAAKCLCRSPSPAATLPPTADPLQNSLKSFKPKRMNSKNIFEHRFEHGHFAACAQFLFAATFQAQIRCVPLLF